MFDYSKGNGWEQYYLEQIMGATPGGGGGKMRRGHKICACLLKWARRMQLLPYEWSEFGYPASSEVIKWDHEASQAFKFRQPHLFFVTEVMRLLAARWREAEENGLCNNRRRRRLRPPMGTTKKQDQGGVADGVQPENNMGLNAS